MNFVPEQPKKSEEVPYFDSANSEGGWQGHTTRKTVDQLKVEVFTSLSRLGGLVTGIQQGEFLIGNKKRLGFQINYGIENSNGSMIPGRLDIAALPVKNTSRNRKSLETRKQQSLKMALYMLRMSLDGAWFLQQLSPGYAPLMPWMLADGKKTITQLWSESASMNNLLPPGDSEFVEGDYVEVGK